MQTQNENYAAFTFVYSLATGWVITSVSVAAGTAVGTFLIGLNVPGGIVVAVSVLVVVTVVFLLNAMFKYLESIFWEVGNML